MHPTIRSPGDDGAGFFLDHPHLHRLLADDGRTADERERLLTLIELALQRPAPPDPDGDFPRYDELQGQLRAALAGDDGDRVEEAFLEWYAHLHMHEAPYTTAERARMDLTGGYWNHAGGISPLLKAAPHIRPDTISADFGAGNGLQGLLLQRLYPHARTVQIEISSRAVEIGRRLQRWLQIPEDRVEWIVGDVLDHSPQGFDFIYLYRPVRPVGAGRPFYERFAADLERSDRQVVIFSIADCLRDFLSPRFEVFYSDGQLTCYRRS